MLTFNWVIFPYKYFVYIKALSYKLKVAIEAQESITLFNKIFVADKFRTILG